jgi:diguanylate cyclase (GGDEF)-like protein/PAS domain S-box-containing protein
LSDRWFGWIVALGGSLLALLLFAASSGRALTDLSLLSNCALAAFLIGALLVIASGRPHSRSSLRRTALEAMSDLMSECVYVTDEQGKTLQVNAAAARFLGYSRERLLGSDAHQLFHAGPSEAGGRANGCPLCGARRRTETFRSENVLLRRADGTIMRVSLVSSPLKLAETIVGSVILFADQTDRVRINQRWRFTDAVFRSMPEAVILTDADSRIRAVNPAFTEISGYQESEVLGQNPVRFSDRLVTEAFYDRIWRSVDRSGSWQGEIWKRRKNGEVYPERVKVTRVKGDAAYPGGYLMLATDISDSLAKDERLRELSGQDQLTHLHDRHAVMELCGHALHRAQGRRLGMALLFLNLDRFKRINESLGHKLGDDLLRHVTKRIRASLREQDEVARLGGDEFVVLLEDVDQDAIPARFCRSLLALLEQPFVVESRRIYLTASIGISLFPRDGTDISTLMKSADTAMHLAKRFGGNGYRYFAPALAEEARLFLHMETNLREALKHEQLRLFYQPQVSLTDGSILGLEALLRWQHPVEGLMLPGRFLATARAAGLMQPVTEWVLREASRQCRVWREAGIPVGRIACNLDAQFFQLTGLEQQLNSTIRDAGIAATDLELEIVETAMQQHTVDDGLWQRLVDAGFALAIDDFGTGESSLSRLKQIPVETLKIDRSFVKDIDRDEDARSIIRAVIAMTKNLGKRVLAEGVETEAQLSFLKEIGCDALQGYLFARPMPADEIPDAISWAAQHFPAMCSLERAV